MTDNDNLFAHFLSAAKAAGDKPFLIEGMEDVLNFSDLDRRSGQLAARLRQLGGALADRIVVQVDKSPEAVLLYLAALRAGLIFVPLNTGYTKTELGYFLENADPAIVVCRPDDETAVRQLTASAVVTLGTAGDGSLLDGIPSQVLPVELRSSSDLAAILYTSGTTGRSKGAMLTHGNLLSNAQTLGELWRWSGDDVLLHILPIYHVHGLFVALHGALLDSELLAEVYLELMGGRQAALGLSAAETEKVGTRNLPQAVIHVKPRPVALPLRLTAEEAEAHSALVKKLGDQAIWRKISGYTG